MSIFAWRRLPRFLGLLRLNSFRNHMRRHNLSDTQAPHLKEITSPGMPDPTPQQKTARAADGAYNDLSKPRMGSAGMRFGHNIPLDRVVLHESTLMTPSPRVVSGASWRDHAA